MNARCVRSGAALRRKSGKTAASPSAATNGITSFSPSAKPRAASGGRRFLELKQQKDGRWGAADGIAPGEHRSDFRWEYGTDYRMSIAVSRTAVTGTLRTMDGNEAAKITVPRTQGEAVTSGRRRCASPDSRYISPNRNEAADGLRQGENGSRCRFFFPDLKPAQFRDRVFKLTKSKSGAALQ